MFLIRTGTIIPRIRLVELLENERQHTMTLVAAPAGYGKSILVSQWLEVSSLPGGWVSLDEGDNDFRVFLSYFLEAILSIFPEQELKTKALIGSAVLPPVKIISRTLLNDLEALTKRFIIILDDYHFINNRVVNDFIAELLIHPSPWMHLVLVTRRDPSLPLTTLRARGMLTEIALKDIRFTVAETKLFLEYCLHLPITDATATILEEKVDGWVTGLHLAALSIRNEADQKRLTDGLQDSSQYVRDYLIQEVLSQASPPFNKYLLQTSILKQFCRPLCEAVFSGDSGPNKTEREINGQAFVNWLVKTHLFLTPLDSNKEWFRYHHMFQQLLLDQLNQSQSHEEIAGLHMKASVWLAENGLFEDAVRHSLAADNTAFAVIIVEQCRYNLMNREEWHRLERLIGSSPKENVDNNPALLVAKACSCWLLHKLDEAWVLLENAECCLSESRQHKSANLTVMVEINALKAYKYLLTNEVDLSLERVVEALDMFTTDHSNCMFRAASISLFGILHQMKGNYSKAIEFIDNALDEKPYPCESYQASLILGLCFVHCAEGNITRLETEAQRLLQVGELHGLPETISYARYFLGMSQYLSNDAGEEMIHLATLVEYRFIARPLYYAHGAFALALNCIYTGRNDDARSIVESVILYGKKSKDTMLSVIGHGFQAELAVQEDRIEDALEWAQLFSPEPFPLFTLFYVPQLTQAKIFVIQNTYKSRQKASILLEELYNFFTRNHKNRFRIQVLALQAALLDRQGDKKNALEKMKSSILLSEHYGLIRDFTDLGVSVTDLLASLLKQNIAVEYIKKVLDAFTDAIPKTESLPEAELSPVQPLIDELTNREIDVLELLAQRLQNKEIAANLYISVETVKAHLKNIYQKLDAGNRRQAVDTAKILKII